MNYYQQTISRLQQSLYPNQDVTARIMQAKRYIEHHYYSEINLDKMAREALMSKFHFIRLFKRYYGRAPHAYLKEVRLAAAKQLLQKGIPIRHVCYAVGFESIPSFTRLYKEMTGTSPARYQRRTKSSPQGYWPKAHH
jgi:AraC-like DNA-binding protein